MPEIILPDVVVPKKKEVRHFSPNRKKVGGGRYKKTGPKKGTTGLKREKVELDTGIITNYLTFGKTEIVHPKNIEAGVQENTPLNITQALREFGLSSACFYERLRRFPDIKEKYELLKKDRREYLKDIVEDAMLNLIVDGDMKDKEKFDASFKVAQATMKEYNPKTEVEAKTISINLNKNTDDIMKELEDLLGK